MKLTIIGNSLVVTSTITKEDYDVLSKYNPEALKIRDEEKNVVFSVATSDKGYVNNHGIGFNGVTRDNNAFLTLTLDVQGVANPKAMVADLFSPILKNLESVEATTNNVAAETKAARNAFLDTIEVM